jgi:hypothetical protein
MLGKFRVWWVPSFNPMACLRVSHRLFTLGCLLVASLAAFELGMSHEQAETLQRIASEELLVSGIKLTPFSPISAPVRRRIE